MACMYCASNAMIEQPVRPAHIAAAVYRLHAVVVVYDSLCWLIGVQWPSAASGRFMGLAEEMGRTLQRTSISVNIKERLDFSCALFAPDGGLVANAPHLPVHLGAMSDAVRGQVRPPQPAPPCPPLPHLHPPPLARYPAHAHAQVRPFPVDLGSSGESRPRETLNPKLRPSSISS